MPCIKYKRFHFHPKSKVIIQQAIEIIEQFQSKGIALTVRQLYYQFVGHDLFPKDWIDKATGSTNNMRSYKKLVDIISRARLAGLIDWLSIIDHTRELTDKASWESPADMLGACADQYHEDLWKGMRFRPEIWVEKDAMLSTIQAVCKELDVPYFSCRGYTSQSSLWTAAMRLKGYEDDGYVPVVIHLGDHDPSGKDMTRDILDRLETFMGYTPEVDRIALNMSQIRKYRPPPNPAKTTDSRYAKYIKEFGEDSWELDALNPEVIIELIRQAVLRRRDKKVWDRNSARAARGRRRMVKLAKTEAKRKHR